MPSFLKHSYVLTIIKGRFPSFLFIIPLSLFCWFFIIHTPETEPEPSLLFLRSLSLLPLIPSISPRLSRLQFICSVMSASLWPCGLQHTRLPCPSPTPGVYSNSCPLRQGYHPTISSSVILFSSCLQSLPASGSFQWVSSSHQVAKVLEFQL